MATDLSYNSIQPRRAGGGGSEDRLSDNYYERFHLNQYYNAVEDEQIYMDEYTSLIHRYNDFITNGYIIFNRMEQTLRENLLRTQTRQYFYYQQHQQHQQHRQHLQHRTSEVGSVAAAAPSTTEAPPATNTTIDTNRISELLPRLLSRYISTDLDRAARQAPQPTERTTNTNNNNHNLFSMLYTVPFAIRTNTDGGTNRSGAGAPTNDQINRATLNTVFSNIISPINATCPISRDEFTDDSQITMIRGCNHIFNRNSLREWFTSHSTCPLCRRDIREYRPLPTTDPTTQQRVQSDDNTSAAVLNNVTIDSIGQDHITFSSPRYNYREYYPDDHHRDHDDDDDEDIMDVD
jgi:hypothetical protein